MTSLEEVQTGSSFDRLVSIMGEYFPNHGDIKYTCSEVFQENQNDMHVPDSSPKYTCELNLFGQTITTDDAYRDKQLALEAASKIGWSILSELVRTIFGKHDSLLDPIFAGVIEDLHSFRPANLSLAEYDKPAGPISSHQSMLLRISEAVQGNATSVKTARVNSEAMSQLVAPHPISSLHEYAMGRCSNPVIEEFSARGLFGCRVIFNNKSYVVEAIFKKKSDAKMEAARLACVDVFGSRFPFAETDEKLPAVDPSKYSFGTSFDAHSAPNAQPRAPVNDIAPSPSAPKQPHNHPPLPNGRKFVSFINEFCQKRQIMAPNYVYSTANTISSIFVCRVDGFLGMTFESASFNRKTDAKEDAASRIYEALEKGKMLNNPPQDPAPTDRSSRKRPPSPQSRHPPSASFPRLSHPPNASHQAPTRGYTLPDFLHNIPPPPFLPIFAPTQNSMHDREDASRHTSSQSSGRNRDPRLYSRHHSTSSYQPSSHRSHDRQPR